jgi:hypothetical protein
MACFYLESNNVEEEGLSFRDGSVGSGGDELGTCDAFSRRILAWPNNLHRKTGEVDLVDKNRQGHRVLCCFNFVDPTLRIRSTATVPNQQNSWMAEMIDGVVLILQGVSEPGALLAAIHGSSITIKDGSTITYEEALERHERQ